MSEQARKSDMAILFECEPTTLWVTENTFVRLPLKPVLTFPPTGTKLFPDGNITLKPTDGGEANVITMEVRVDL